MPRIDNQTVSASSGLEEAWRLHPIPMALGLIVAVGAIFLLLAAYEVCPQGPNEVSRLGGWGKALGFTILAVDGILVLVATCQCSNPQQERAHTEKMQRMETEIRNSIQAFQKQVQAASKPRATRLVDGKTLTEGDTLKYNGAASSLKLDLGMVDVLADVLADYQKKHPDKPLPEGLREPKAQLSHCIQQFQDLYTNGRYHIEPSAQDDGWNKLAANLNQKIEELKRALAEKLAEYYPISSPPPEFASPQGDALVELCACWQSLAK